LLRGTCLRSAEAAKKITDQDIHFTCHALGTGRVEQKPSINCLVQIYKATVTHRLKHPDRPEAKLRKDTTHR